jgi:hypothetical protein
MLHIDIVICIGSLPILETWPPIYRGQERMVGIDWKQAKFIFTYYFWYTPCLTDLTFEFIQRPTPPILSPSSRTFVELTLIRWCTWSQFESNTAKMHGWCTLSQLESNTINRHGRCTWSQLESSITKRLGWCPWWRDARAAQRLGWCP